MKNSEQLILCDLGGVLIDLNWNSHAGSLFGGGMSPETLKSRWLGLASVRAYEAGKIDFAGFYQQFCAETGSNTVFDDFRREFIGILGPDKPGCDETLARLAKAGRLAMLSNTNELHVATLRGCSRVFDHFDDLFFSYELGLVKPDSNIFFAVCERTGHNPGQVFFFDDSEVNIAAAKSCGLHAWRVDSPAEIEKIIAAQPDFAMI